MEALFGKQWFIQLLAEYTLLNYPSIDTLSLFCVNKKCSEVGVKLTRYLLTDYNNNHKYVKETLNEIYDLIDSIKFSGFNLWLTLQRAVHVVYLNEKFCGLKHVTVSSKIEFCNLEHYLAKKIIKKYMLPKSPK
jgi:hypothetical protein